MPKTSKMHENEQKTDANLKSTNFLMSRTKERQKQREVYKAKIKVNLMHKNMKASNNIKHYRKA